MSSLFGAPFQVTNMTVEMIFILDHRFREHVRKEPHLRQKCDQSKYFFCVFRLEANLRCRNCYIRLPNHLDITIPPGRMSLVFDAIVRQFVHSPILEEMFKPRKVLSMDELRAVISKLICHPLLVVPNEAFDKVHTFMVALQTRSGFTSNIGDLTKRPASTVCLSMCMFENI
jgi:hypothetical protein